MPEINSEQLKKWAPLGAAGVLGLAAAGLGWVVMSPAQQVQHAAHPDVKLAKIVVAARDLTAGTELTAEDLTYLKVEAANVPDDTFRKISDLLEAMEKQSDEELDDGAGSGRVITSDVATGQPLMARHLAPQDTPAGVSAMLPKGYRAISVDVRGDTGLTGLLQPGSHVDVVATLSDNEATVVRTIAQDVYVLAVGTKIAGIKEPKADDRVREHEERNSSVTLVVTPEQAGRIDLAFTSGSPRLVMRGGGDRALSRFSGLTFADLIGTSHSDGDFGYAQSEFEKPNYPSFEQMPVRTNNGSGSIIENATANGSAGLDFGEISAPSQVAPVSRPTRRPEQDGSASPKPEPVSPPRFVEVIRGGTATQEQVPTPGHPVAAPSKDSDPFD